MAGGNLWLNGHEFEWTLGDSDEQGGLACCNLWDRKESDTTEWLNWTELSTEELMLLNCVVIDNSWESLDCKIKPVNSKGNHSWIFIGRTNAKAETPMLWSLMQITDLLEKTMKVGKIESRRRWGWQRMRWLEDITDLMDLSLTNTRELVMDRVARAAAVFGVAKSSTWLSDWTSIMIYNSQSKTVITFAPT